MGPGDGGRYASVTHLKRRALFDILDKLYIILFDEPLEGRKFRVFEAQNERESIEGAYGERTLAINQSVFSGVFGHALAVFLHESVHPYGCDGSRGFSDQLTEAMEALWEHRQQVELLEQIWRGAQGDGKLLKGTKALNAEEPRVQATTLDARLRTVEEQVAKLLRKRHG